MEVKKTPIETLLKEVEENDERPIPLQGVKNVWCVSFTIDDELALINFVKTSNS